ncbi:MAG: class I tRNA ligase family protein, partial [Patescibacteria group bacterium]
TSKFPSYGRLSGQRLEEKEEGARVTVNVEKRNKTDFALWKLSGALSKRQQEWPSPWGVGFPGWHIECSAMSRKYLGQPFDIHCGGVDHISVHHENEIAQSEAAYGVKLANYWLHNEFLAVESQKMSKSLGNVYTVSDIESRGFDPLALRYLYLGTHYRQKENFTWDALQAAQNALTRLRETIREWDAPEIGCAEYETNFTTAIEDDLNTPIALSMIWKLVGDATYPSRAKSATMLFMDRVFGLSLCEMIGRRVEIPEDIQRMIVQREEARRKKEWSRADDLRRAIQERGWSIEDTTEGTKAMPM